MPRQVVRLLRLLLYVLRCQGKHTERLSVRIVLLFLNFVITCLSVTVDARKSIRFIAWLSRIVVVVHELILDIKRLGIW